MQYKYCKKLKNVKHSAKPLAILRFAELEILSVIFILYKVQVPRSYMFLPIVL